MPRVLGVSGLGSGIFPTRVTYQSADRSLRSATPAPRQPPRDAKLNIQMGFDKAKAVNAAEKYLAQGKIAAAVQEYRRIVDADADDFTALNTLGDLYIRVDKQ